MTQEPRPNLTDKQQAFVEHYLVCLNATEAAIKAGYSESSARQMGSANMSKPAIAAEIARRKEARKERLEVTAERVILELARIAFTSLPDVAEWDEDRATFVPSRDLDTDAAAAVRTVKAKTTRYHGKDGQKDRTEVRLEVRMHDKLRALEALGKHLGLFGNEDEKVRLYILQTIQQLPPDKAREIADSEQGMREFLSGFGLELPSENGEGGRGRR